MSKPLFENVGRDLKTIAKAIYRETMIGYILVSLASLGLSICMGTILDSEGALVLIGVLLAIGIAVFGHFKAKLAVMKLYAYGELVDRVISIEESISRKTGGGKSVPKEKPKVTPVSVKIDTPVTKRNADGSWVCPFCDHLNRPGADWCEECGVEARFE